MPNDAGKLQHLSCIEWSFNSSGNLPRDLFVLMVKFVLWLVDSPESIAALLSFAQARSHLNNGFVPAYLKVVSGRRWWFLLALRLPKYVR